MNAEICTHTLLIHIVLKSGLYRYGWIKEPRAIYPEKKFRKIAINML